MAYYISADADAGGDGSTSDLTSGDNTHAYDAFGNVNWVDVRDSGGRVLQIVEGSSPLFITGTNPYNSVGQGDSLWAYNGITIQGTLGNMPVITTEIEWTDQLWVESPTYSDVYYLTSSGGGDPSVANPTCGAIKGHYRSEQVNNDFDRERWSTDQHGGGGSELVGMTDNNWAYGDFDTLGFSTIYVKVAGGIDPSTLSQDDLILAGSEAEVVNNNRSDSVFQDIDFRCGYHQVRDGNDGDPCKYIRCFFRYNDDRAFNANVASSTSANYPQFICCVFWWSGHGAIDMSAGATGLKMYNCTHVADHVAGKSTTTKTANQQITLKNNIYLWQGEGGFDIRDAYGTTGTDDTSSGATFLTDSTQSGTWVADEFVGYEIRNYTDGSRGNIIGNTTTTITATMSGGANNTWDSGDAYIIMKPDHVTFTEDYNVFAPRLSSTPSGAAPSGDVDGDLFYRGSIEAESGTATSGTATVLTDTATGGGGAWTTNEFQGMIIYNTTDGSSGVIVSNTSNTITVGDLTGGTANTFATSDVYFVEDFSLTLWPTTGEHSSPSKVDTDTHKQRGYDYPDDGTDAYRAEGVPLPRYQDVCVNFKDSSVDNFDSADLRPSTNGVADGTGYAWWVDEGVSAPVGIDGVDISTNMVRGAYGGTSRNLSGGGGGSGGGGSVGSPVGTTVC